MGGKCTRFLHEVQEPKMSDEVEAPPPLPTPAEPAPPLPTPAEPEVEAPPPLPTPAEPAETPALVIREPAPLAPAPPAPPAPPVQIPAKPRMSSLVFRR